MSARAVNTPNPGREAAAQSLLRDGLSGAGLSTELERTLWTYYKLLRSWNTRTNLVSQGDASDPVTFVQRHILDSIAPWSIVSDFPVPGAAVRNGPLLLRDIGSGGGLPGIPLTIALDWVGREHQMQLIERSYKKTAFLHAVVASLKLGSCKPVEQDFIRPIGGSVEADVTVTCRALSPWPDTLFASLDRRYTGRLLYFAGRNDRLPPDLVQAMDEREGRFMEYTVPGQSKGVRRLAMVPIGPERRENPTVRLNPAG